MHPHAFAESLKHKMFSNGADCEVVAKLYADSFAGALGHATKVNFVRTGWKDAQAMAFAEVLPELKALETLDLSGNIVGTRGIDALTNAIRAGAAPKLTRFNFMDNVMPETIQEWTKVRDALLRLLEACEERGIAFKRSGFC